MDSSFETKRKVARALVVLCLILIIYFCYLFFTSQDSEPANELIETTNSYDLDDLKSQIIQNEADRKTQFNDLKFEIISISKAINELEPLLGKKTSHKIVGVGVFIPLGLLLSTLVLYNIQKKSF